MASPLKPSDLRGAPFRWDPAHQRMVDCLGNFMEPSSDNARNRLGRFIVAALNAEAERMKGDKT